MCLNDLSGCNLIGLASSLAILLSENLSADDIRHFSGLCNSSW